MLYPRFPLLNGASEDFRDLHCIECGAFTDLVAHYPQVECVGKNKVFTNPAHKAIILAGSVEWDRKRFVRNIVDDLNASSVSIGWKPSATDRPAPERRCMIPVGLAGS